MRFEELKCFGDVYLIAEIGVNYYDIAKERNISPLAAAKLMIDEAAAAGIQCVKFQSYKGDKLVTASAPSYWDTSKESIGSQRELFEKFDHFGAEQYEELSQYSKKKGIDFMSTPFDEEAADYLEGLMGIYKVSSSDINNIPFIKYMAKKKKPMLISTGAADIKEIQRAVDAVFSTGNKMVGVMHCILEYPTPDADANLLMIRDLKEHFPDLILGYSDHTVPDSEMDNLFSAFVLGARVIEKHFTLNKALPGNDHYHAMDTKDAKKFLNKASRFIKLAGSKEKTCLPGEENSRSFARRSLVSSGMIKKGEKLTIDNITFKRPGTGIPPYRADEVLGKPVLRDIPDDTTIKFDMLGD